MFDLDRALSDEEYARSIIIDYKTYDYNIYFDDIIFILSCMIASNIFIDIWKEKINNNLELYRDEIVSAGLIHSYEWEDAVSEVINDFELNNRISGKFLSEKESRNKAFDLSKNILKNFNKGKNSWNPFA